MSRWAGPKQRHRALFIVVSKELVLIHLSAEPWWEMGIGIVLELSVKLPLTENAEAA